MYREKFTFTVIFASLDCDGIMLCAGMRRDRQCTDNVTARRVRVASHYESVSVFLRQLSGIQSACAVLYCHLWPICLYRILPDCFTNNTIFGIRSLSMKRVFWFSLELYLKYFSLQEEFGEILSPMYIGIHVQGPLFLSDFNADGTGFNTCKECHKTQSLWNHTTTDHKEGEQLEDRKNVGESSCNCGDGTDQRVQSLLIIIFF